jgi:hypothetical protein
MHGGCRPNAKTSLSIPDLKLLSGVIMTNFTRWPSITLTIADRERLERLANASKHCFPHTADYLAHEIERARVLDSETAKTL